MFGNLFKTDTAAPNFPKDKCRWCLKRIGLDAPKPIPVCRDCWLVAYGDPQMWDRLTGEFEKETRALVRQMRATPDLSDAIVAGNEATREIHELQKRVFDLIAEGKQDEAKKLNAEVQLRMNELFRFRKEAPVLMAEAAEEEV